MKRSLYTAAIAVTLSLSAAVSVAQSFSPKWEDLTSADFVKAIKQSGGVCLLPFGSIEKFGPSGPLGTNLYLGRVVTMEAVKQEYAVVFPEYFAAVTANTSNLPGTITYSPRLQFELLDETTSEMARNGCKKILIVNAHSSNTSFLGYFLSNFTLTPHDYVVYSIYGPEFPVNPAQLAKLPAVMQPSKPGADGHGGEERIAAMLAYYPELVHLDRAHDEPSESGHGAEQVRHVGTGFMDVIPLGYSGDASGATAARGKALVQNSVDRLVQVIRDIKADKTTLGVEKAFSELRKAPDNAK